MPPSKDLLKRLKIVSVIDWAVNEKCQLPPPTQSCPPPVGALGLPEPGFWINDYVVFPVLKPQVCWRILSYPECHLPAPGYSSSCYQRPIGFPNACEPQPSGLVWLDWGVTEGMGWRTGLPEAAPSALSSPPETKQGSFVSGHTQGQGTAQPPLLSYPSVLTLLGPQLPVPPH